MTKTNRDKSMRTPPNKQKSFKGRFCPTPERLREITENGAALLENATEEQLGTFEEHSFAQLADSSE